MSRDSQGGPTASVSVVSYGLGNLGSIVSMFRRIGVLARLVSTPQDILASQRVLLPGVGAFDTAMRMLDERGLVRPLRDFAAGGRPMLGICLGMQLLFDASDEGTTPGLGLIGGRSRRIAESHGVRVPHMGWNRVEALRADPLVEGLPAENRFYFVHSYRVVPDDDRHVLARTKHGEEFASMVRVGDVMGAQFHPEKSHDFGMRILSNFSTL